MNKLHTNNISFLKTADLFFVFALLSRFLFIVFQPLKDTDYELVHIAADNLIAGKGLAFPRTFLNDLSVIYYDPMRYWPPFTALLVALVKTVTNNVIVTDLFLLFTGMTGLLFTLKKIIKALELNPVFQCIIWIILATNPSAFSAIGLSDLYGCLFCLWSTFLCISYLNSFQQNKTIPLFASLIFFLPAAFRYQYYPVIFAFPLFLIIAGRVTLQPNLVRKGFYSFFLVTLFLGLQSLFLSYHTNSIVYANDPKGFFPANLVFMYPVFIKALINSSYFENRMLEFFEWFNLPYLIVNLTLMVIVYLFLTRYFIIRFRMIRNVLNEFIDKKKILLQFLFFIVASAVIFTLAAASLIYNNRSKTFGGWTYVNEARYFMVPVLLILPMLLKLIQEKFKRISLLSILLGIAMLYNVALWCKFVYNIISDNLSKKEVQNIADRAFIHNKILNLQKNPLPVIVSYTEPYFAFFPIQERYAITKKINILLDSGYKTTEPVQLLIITEKNPLQNVTDFLFRNNATAIYTGQQCKLFYLVVEKNSSSK